MNEVAGAVTTPATASVDLAAKEAGVQPMQVDCGDKSNDEVTRQKVSV